MLDIYVLVKNTFFLLSNGIIDFIINKILYLSLSGFPVQIKSIATCKFR
jgi:hypothetical protein